MTDQRWLVNLKLSIQLALVGEVPDNMFSVTCGIRGQTVVVRAYYTTPVTEDDIEHLQCISTEVIADFPEGFKIEEEALPLSGDEPEMLDFWAFKRMRADG